jgi:hypothetical protein
MKGERKLRLVTGGGGRPPEGDEPPFTDEEIAAAAALRDALEAGGDPLALELRAAHVPGPLAPADLDAIVARAFGDDAATTAAERAAAERLRAELCGEAPPSAESELFRALQLAVHPTDLPAARHQALIDAALSRPILLGRLSTRPPVVRRIAPVTMVALAGVAALAAGVALFVAPSGTRPPVTAALVRTRSADSLFDPATPFPRRGEESARIDRITSARVADLRQNRFTAWGVK